MIAGWPFGAWLLLLAAIWIGLAIELRFYMGQRRQRVTDGRAGR